MSDRNSSFLPWLWVGLCALGIYSSVPLARKIQRFVYNTWGSEVFLYLVLITVGGAFAGLVYWLVFKLKVHSPRQYIWLVIITALYIHFTWQLKGIPEEAVHFLEYGVLSFFLFKALSRHITDKSIYITATLFAIFIGTIDESLQWMMPDRYWDFRDAGLNGLSGGLFQLALATVVLPKVISGRFSAKSMKWLSGTLGACLLLLGLCASNTPNRVATYAPKIPGLYFLLTQEPMSEFGFKHTDPEIGTFKSRLSLAELRAADREHGKEFAAILDENKDMPYGDFLAKYNPKEFPFLHELRVHLFRRNRFHAKGLETQDSQIRDVGFFVAYKENRIIQKFFPMTISRSRYRWNESNIAQWKGNIDMTGLYKSEVSAHLFTTFYRTTDVDHHHHDPRKSADSQFPIPPD